MTLNLSTTNFNGYYTCAQFTFWFLTGLHFKMLVTKGSCTLYSIHPPKRPVQELGQIDVKLTCSMGKGPGKSSSKTARSGHGRKNMSCPKDKLEFKFFSSPVILCKSMCVIILTKHRSKWIDIVQFPFLHFCGPTERPLLYS